jgi:hypothetical protein
MEYVTAIPAYSHTATLGAEGDRLHGSSLWESQGFDLRSGIEGCLAGSVSPTP